MLVMSLCKTVVCECQRFSSLCDVKSIYSVYVKKSGKRRRLTD